MKPYLNYKQFLENNNNCLSDSKILIVVTFYKFFHIKKPIEFQNLLKLYMKNTNIKGTILIAEEGINGTICGVKSDISPVLNNIWLLNDLFDLDPKYSLTNKAPFFRMKIRLKREIVTLGINNVSPNKTVGHYIKPEDWNKFISDDNVLLIDTRNAYEVSIGSFDNAINPYIKSFRDFPKWVSNNLLKDKKIDKDKKIGMFCTGGIRCEKSTSYLKSLGFKNVFHLDGGILKYLEKTSEDKSKWNGSCFVFDYRVSVKHNLEVGHYDMCYACRMPISDSDKKSIYFVQSESCHHCFNTLNIKQKKRFKERRKQIGLFKKKILAI